jgi:Fic family protein
MSEQKKALVPKGPETPVAVADPLAQATGTSDPEVAARLARQVISVLSLLAPVLFKARFWERFATEALNDRQIKVINRILDGFEGKLTSSKWARLARCSQDTAYRDILDLMERGVLKKNPGGGRSTSYDFADI